MRAPSLVVYLSVSTSMLIAWVSNYHGQFVLLVLPSLFVLALAATILLFGIQTGVIHVTLWGRKATGNDERNAKEITAFFQKRDAQRAQSQLIKTSTFILLVVTILLIAWAVIVNCLTVREQLSGEFILLVFSFFLTCIPIVVQQNTIHKDTVSSLDSIKEILNVIIYQLEQLETHDGAGVILDWMLDDPNPEQQMVEHLEVLLSTQVEMLEQLQYRLHSPSMEDIYDDCWLCSFSIQERLRRTKKKLNVCQEEKEDEELRSQTRVGVETAVGQEESAVNPSHLLRDDSLQLEESTSDPETTRAIDKNRTGRASDGQIENAPSSFTSATTLARSGTARPSAATRRSTAASKSRQTSTVKNLLYDSDSSDSSESTQPLRTISGQTNDLFYDSNSAASSHSSQQSVTTRRSPLSPIGHRPIPSGAGKRNNNENESEKKRPRLLNKEGGDGHPEVKRAKITPHNENSMMAIRNALGDPSQA